jgi:hypothetical protein
MIYRQATDDDHELIVKQVRSDSIQNACLLIPVIPLAVLFMCLSVNMMIRDNYDEETLVVCSVIYAMMLIGVVVFILFLMKDVFKRISFINKRKYTVADCTVESKERQAGYRYSRHFIKVNFPDGWWMKLRVPPKIFYKTEEGMKAITVKYDEPENKKNKLPEDLAVIFSKD